MFTHPVIYLKIHVRTTYVTASLVPQILVVVSRVTVEQL